MKKAVIFDLDGTLANTIESLTYCGNRALQKFGLPSFTQEDYKYFVGDGSAVLVRRALTKAGDAELTHYDEVYEEYCRLFAKDCMYQVRPYDGIIPLLEELKKYPSGDVFIIGGESVYRQLLPYCDTAHVTKIDHEYDADSYFPDLDQMPEWEITGDSEEQTYFDLEYRFLRYQKK